jgi:hypothetical protein
VATVVHLLPLFPLTASGTTQLAWCINTEDRSMQQETTRYQWMISSARRLQAGMRRGGGVGVLAVLLLLPLTAAGQAPPGGARAPEE